jgi:hypothetical protein
MGRALEIHFPHPSAEITQILITRQSSKRPSRGIFSNATQAFMPVLPLSTALDLRRRPHDADQLSCRISGSFNREVDPPGKRRRIGAVAGADDDSGVSALGFPVEPNEVEAVQGQHGSSLFSSVCQHLIIGDAGNSRWSRVSPSRLPVRAERIQSRWQCAG